MQKVSGEGGGGGTPSPDPTLLGTYGASIFAPMATVLKLNVIPPEHNPSYGVECNYCEIPVSDV